MSAACKTPVHCDKQMHLNEDDSDGIAVNDGTNKNSHINTADDRAPQTLNTSQNLNMDEFDTDLELMDKLEYDGSSDSDANDDLDYVPYDFENRKFSDVHAKQ